MCTLSVYLVNEIRHSLSNHAVDPILLAKSASIKPSNLKRILVGSYSPSLEVLERLYVCLGLQIEVHRGCNTYANGVVYSDSSHLVQFPLVEPSFDNNDLPF